MTPHSRNIPGDGWVHLRCEATALTETRYFCYCRKSFLVLRNEVPSGGLGCFYWHL